MVSRPPKDLISSASEPEDFEIQFDLPDESEQDLHANIGQLAEDFAIETQENTEPNGVEEFVGEADQVKEDVEEPNSFVDEAREELVLEAQAWVLPEKEFLEVVSGELSPWKSVKQSDEPSLSMKESLSLEGQVEALLFAASKPMKAGEILEIIQDVGEQNTKQKDVDHAISTLQRWYEERGGGFRLVSVKNQGFQMQTVEAASMLMERLFSSRPRPLSRAALETLAIIAYRQPATRADIEYIRGVDAGSIIKNLMDRDLICCVGRKEDAGRPMLFGTTDEFLRVFGIETLSELPPLSAFQPSNDNIGAALEQLDKSPEEREAPVDIEPMIGDEARQKPELSSGLIDEQPGLSLEESLEESRAGASQEEISKTAEHEGNSEDEGSQIHSELGSVFEAGGREVDESGESSDKRQDSSRDGQLD